MSDNKDQVAASAESYWADGAAESLVSDCSLAYSWPDDFARRVLRSYRQFLEVKQIMEDWDATMLSPTKLVEMMWRQHILDIRSYLRYCDSVCGEGKVIHHKNEGLDGEAMKARLFGMRAAIKVRYGGEVDDRVWNFDEELGDDVSIMSWVTMFPRAKGTKTKFKDSAVRSGANGAKTKVKKSVVRSGAKSVKTKVKKSAVRSGQARNRTAGSVTLGVLDQTGEETLYRLKKSSKMRKVFLVVASRKGARRDDLLFYANGKIINDSETPASLELKTQDQIKVYPRILPKQCGRDGRILVKEY